MSHKFGQNSTKESGTQLFFIEKKIIEIRFSKGHPYLTSHHFLASTEYRKSNFVFIFPMKIWKKPPLKVQKLIYFFICISLDYMGYDINKEF